MLVLYFSLFLPFQHDDNGVKKGSHDEGLDKILLMFYDMKDRSFPWHIRVMVLYE